MDILSRETLELLRIKDIRDAIHEVMNDGSLVRTVVVDGKIVTIRRVSL